MTNREAFSPLIDRRFGGLKELNCSKCPIIKNIPLINDLEDLKCYRLA